MSYIEISSQGLINQRFFTLLGASTKRGEDKIGFFGSGLKYSLAYLLRNDIEFHIFIGEREVLFSVERVEEEGKTFDIICVNGKQSDITTDFGPKWKAWMVVRELYSNAVDEGDHKMDIVETPAPKENRTTVYIKLEKDFELIYEKFDDYFSMNKEVVLVKKQKLGWCSSFEGSEDDVEVKILKKHETKGLRIYRKGICVHESLIPSLYDYDVSRADINEERLASDMWELTKACVSALINTPLFLDIKYETLFPFYDADKIWEHIQISTSNFYSDKVAFDHLVEAIGDKRTAPIEAYTFYSDYENLYWLPLPLVTLLTNKYGVMSVIENNPSKLFKKPSQQEFSTFNHSYLLDAIDLLKKLILDYELEQLDLNVELVIFKDEQILGTINRDENIIYMSVKLRDPREILMVLIEEYLHLVSGYGDRTREFQMQMLEIITKIAEKNGLVQKRV